jgi:hypothetical protein
MIRFALALILAFAASAQAQAQTQTQAEETDPAQEMAREIARVIRISPGAAGARANWLAPFAAYDIDGLPGSARWTAPSTPLSVGPMRGVRW